jgi:hypothetical protein
MNEEFNIGKCEHKKSNIYFKECPFCKPKEELIEEFEKQFDYLNNDYGAKLEPIEQFIKTQIKQAEERERERIVKEIEKFSNRNDDEILEEIGISAPYPAPCSRKTCNLLVTLINQNNE